MGIGTSKGAYYEDQFHYSQSQWDPKYDTNDKNVLAPDTVQRNKDLNSDPNNITDDGGNIVDYDFSGKSVKDLQLIPKIEQQGFKMPFPNNNNPDTDFVNRFPNLPPSGILNDLKKPGDTVPPLARKIDYQTSNPLVTITDQDIDQATSLALSFSGGGLTTKGIGVDPIHLQSPEAARFRLGQLQRDKAASRKAGDDVEGSDYMFYNNQIRQLKEYLSK